MLNNLARTQTSVRRSYLRKSLRNQGSESDGKSEEEPYSVRQQHMQRSWGGSCTEVARMVGAGRKWESWGKRKQGLDPARVRGHCVHASTFSTEK